MVKDGNYGRGINDYSRKLKLINFALAQKLFEGPDYKEESMKILRETGLPRFKTVIMDLSEFLKNKEEVYLQFEYTPDFINIINKKTGERNRKEGVSKEGIDVFIKNIVTDLSKVGDYKILVSESPEILYGGVLVISSPEKFYMEMVKGSLTDLVSKNKLPDYTASYDKENAFDLSIKYSGSVDDKLKLKMYEIIQLTKFRIGYYEFCLAKTDPKSDKLTPFFFEYSDKETYLF